MLWPYQGTTRQCCDQHADLWGLSPAVAVATMRGMYVACHPAMCAAATALALALMFAGVSWVPAFLTSAHRYCPYRHGAHHLQSPLQRSWKLLAGHGTTCIPILPNVAPGASPSPAATSADSGTGGTTHCMWQSPTLADDCWQWLLQRGACQARPCTTQAMVGFLIVHQQLC
jgi:hypothetical protein